MSYALAALLLLVAVGLRMWDLPTLPPGLNDHEIDNIRFTETVRNQGDIRVFYDLNDLTGQGSEGREGLYYAALALSTTLVGNGLLGYRLFSLWVGLITLALVYALSRRLFGPLAAVMAMALMALGMLPIILSRTVRPEAVVPLVVATVLLAQAHALPVYRRIYRRGGTTTAFAVYGVSIGLSFYIHPMSLMVALSSMVFIVYIIVTRQPLSRRRLSYVGFGLLVAIILIIPYLISSLRLPELAATDRVFGDYNGIIRSFSNGIVGIFFQGDSSPIYNLPGRPLVDLISGLFILIGVVMCIRYWRQSRFALPLLTFIILLPAVFLVANTPHFINYGALLPILALFFGLGTHTIYVSLRRGTARRIAVLGLLLLLAYNFIWTIRDLFIQWPTLPEVQTAYHSRVADMAIAIDRTASDIPTVVCTSRPGDNGTARPLNDNQLLQIMLNNRNAIIRLVDCTTGLILTSGGETEQLVVTDPDVMTNTHFYLRDWIESGTSSEIEGIVSLSISERVADTVGRFTTTAPVIIAGTTREGVPTGDNPEVFPPVRFGGNLTFLGYDYDPTIIYHPGDLLSVITYWRVDGALPSDLSLFVHVLFDPTTIAVQNDTISIVPQRMQERDIFIQVTNIPLPETLLAGEYTISVGAVVESTDERLFIFHNDQPFGRRLFLYPIRVATAESDSTDSE